MAKEKGVSISLSLFSRAFQQLISQLPDSKQDQHWVSQSCVTFYSSFMHMGYWIFLLSQGERMWYTLIRVYSLWVSSKGKHYHMCSDKQKSSSVLYKPCDLPGVPVLEQLYVTTFSGKYSIVMHKEHGFWQSGRVKKWSLQNTLTGQTLFFLNSQV